MRLLEFKLHPFIAAVGILSTAVPAVHAQDLVLAEGHYDLAVTYEPDSGWRTYIHDFDNGDEVPPISTVLRVGESARAVVPDDPAYARLGAPGDSVWIVPELYDRDIIYLGMGAPLMRRNVFTGGLSNRGQVTMRLVAIEGSGPEAGGTMSLWQSGFPPRFYFSSADGINEEDALDTITANFHAHFNYAFTAPGLYRITFEYEGELVPELGGSETSTRVTYTFEVGDSNDTTALRYAWPLGDGWAWSTWMGTHYQGFAPWIWDYVHGWIYLPPADPDSVNLWTFDHGWVWTNQFYYPWLWNQSTGEWISP